MEVLFKFNPKAQELASSTEWRKGIPLYLGEVKIEDMNNLSLSLEKKNIIANIDEMLVSTFGMKLFYRDKVTFNLDQEKKERSSNYSMLR